MATSPREESSPKRPSTVTFKVRYDASSRPSLRPVSAASNRPGSDLISVKKPTKTKTADLSHISDRRSPTSVPSFIPAEYKREVTTPTPLRPGTGTLIAEERQWHTQIFPTETGESITEVEMLGEWLNEMLEKNQNERAEPRERAKGARHWYGVAFNELCRQVASDCPERAQLMSSIWKRYQMLFSRVAQLHEEERTYLVVCHKERVSRLKEQVEQMQAKLKAISQQYKDDQERYSNAREREDTKFSNLRKKLDLLVKSKRNLTLKIRSLKEKIEKGGEEISAVETAVVEIEKKAEVPPLNEQELSDKVHAVREKVRKEQPHFAEISGALDTIARYIDHTPEDALVIRDIYPQFFQPLPGRFAGHVRSPQWLMAALTAVYGERLTALCASRYSGPYPEDRMYCMHVLYGYFLRFFGTPHLASEALFDLVQTAHALAKADNARARLFLQFIDCSEQNLDSVYLDFYCFCIGSFIVSNTQSSQMFDDVFEEETCQFASISHNFAVEIARKILFSICEGDVADTYVDRMISSLELSERDKETMISVDLVFESLIEIYKMEEKRISEQLREQYEMDAAEEGGVVTLAQFQTLVTFSPRKVDNRVFCEMMSAIFRKTPSHAISPALLTESMHKTVMLVPFVFDRIDYDIAKRPNDANGLMKAELVYRTPELDHLLYRLQRSDETAYGALMTLKTKLDQVIESNRTGAIAEIANREFYGHLLSAGSD